MKCRPSLSCSSYQLRATSAKLLSDRIPHGKVLFAIICCWKGFSKMVAILAKCIFQEVRSGVEKNLKVILEPCLPFPDCVWEGSHFPGLLL